MSKTGDEIEFLGESFNRMIEALAASRKKLQDNQELLEKRIKNAPISWKKPRGAHRPPTRPRANFWPTSRTNCGRP